MQDSRTFVAGHRAGKTAAQEALIARRLRRSRGWSARAPYGENRHARRAFAARGGRIKEGLVVSVRLERADGRCIGRKLQLVRPAEKVQP